MNAAMGDDTHPSEAVALVTALAHDVGKYISRTAINLGAYPLSTPLLALLIADLYQLKGALRASAVFEGYAVSIEAILGPSVPLGLCRQKLVRIDALEARVRAGEGPAVTEAAALAIDIFRLLVQMRDSMISEGS